jgi:hypothetical protein
MDCTHYANYEMNVSGMLLHMFSTCVVYVLGRRVKRKYNNICSCCVKNLLGLLNFFVHVLLD